jgi:hypothetical protein
LSGGKFLSDAADKIGYKNAASKAAKKEKNAEAGNKIQKTRRGKRALEIVEEDM